MILITFGVLRCWDIVNGKNSTKVEVCSLTMFAESRTVGIPVGAAERSGARRADSAEYLMVPIVLKGCKRNANITSHVGHDHSYTGTWNFITIRILSGKSSRLLPQKIIETILMNNPIPISLKSSQKL